MIKLIAMDLDGTLFDNDHKSISDRNVNALKAAAKKGIKIVISSGRTYCQITNVLKRIEAVDYVLASNGAAVIDNMGNTISSDCIEYDKWKEVYNILEKNDIVTEVFFNGNTYMKSSDIKRYGSPHLNDDFIEELLPVINLCDNVTETLRDKKVEKLVSLYVNNEKAIYLKKIFENLNMVVTSSVPENMEINKYGTNKGAGLKRLCDIININSDEVMAFGDGGNDVEMLKWAGCSFAMKNAEDDVKMSAKYIADYNYNDGIAKEIEKRIL